MNARVIQVIESEITRGRGTTDSDPVRIVRQYWSIEGQLLAEVDTFTDNERVIDELNLGRPEMPSTEPATGRPLSRDDRIVEKLTLALATLDDDMSEPARLATMAAYVAVALEIVRSSRTDA